MKLYRVVAFMLAVVLSLSVYPMTSVASDHVHNDTLVFINDVAHSEQEPNVIYTKEYGGVGEIFSDSIRSVFIFTQDDPFIEEDIELLAEYLLSNEGKTVVVLSDGTLTGDVRNGQIMIDLLNMYPDTIYVTDGEMSAITDPSGDIETVAGDRCIDFTYVTLDAHAELYVYADGDCELHTHSHEEKTASKSVTVYNDDGTPDVTETSEEDVTTPEEDTTAPEEDTEPAVCDHEYESVVTPPDCTERGYTTHTCKHCGDSYVDNYTDASHTPGAEATCTDPQVCTGCGEVLAETIDHTPGTDATCIDPQVCTECGETLTEATDHTPGEAATCTEPQKCVNCDFIYQAATGHTAEEKPCDEDATCIKCGELARVAGQHAYTSVVTPPTCTEQGYTTFTCSTCGDVTTGDNVPATGHTAEEKPCDEAAMCAVCGELARAAGQHAYTSVVTSPTCTEDGYTTFTCSTCGDVTTGDNVAATGHTAEEKPCDEAAMCAVCGELARAAGQHAYTSVVTPPTCTEQGYTTFTCSSCGDVTTGDNVAATGHTAEEKPCDEDATCIKCGELARAAGQHAYTSVVTPPTCTEQGYTTFTCSVCGDITVDDEVAAKGHIPGDAATCTTPQKCVNCDYICEEAKGHTPGDAATCTTPQKCVNCDYIYEEAKGHKYNSVVTPPTCTEKGYTTFTCSACGHKYTDNYVDATKHDYTPTVTPPACTAEGYTTYYCPDCGDEYVGDFVPAEGHKYTHTVTPPTCTENGYTTHTCVHGDDEYIDSYTDPTGHAEGDAATCTTPQICTVCEIVLADALGHAHIPTVVPPTCTEDGYTIHECSRCDDEYKTDTVAKLEHDYTVVVTPPTCTEQGYTTHTCKRGDYEYVDAYTVATGHTDGPAATCTTPQICTVCEIVLADALGHAHIPTVVPPTCTEDGYTIHECSRCDDDYKTDTVEMLGHDIAFVVIPPTCTTDGYTANTCQRCKHSYTSDKVDRLNHLPNIEAATCTDDMVCTRVGCNTVIEKAKGHTLGEDATCTTPQICTVCKEEIKSENGHIYGPAPTCTDPQVCLSCDEVLNPAKGHTPTAEADCLNAQTCTVCEAVLVEALGHDYRGAGTVKTQPTCTEAGYTTYTCQRQGCGESHKDDYVDPKGHSYGAWSTVTAATCTADGQRKKTCRNCGDEVTEVLTKLGHNYTSTVTKPTCTTEGYTTHKCSRCGNIYTDTNTVALGHDLKVTVIPAECEKDGYTHRECKRTGCGYEDTIDPTTATGHNWSGWVTVREPSFFQPGISERECKNCHVTQQYSIEQTDDTTPPTGSIKVKTSEYTTFPSNVENELFYPDRFDVTFSATDDESGMKSLEYYVSHKALTFEEVKNIDDWTSAQTSTLGTHQIVDEAEYVIYLRMYDKANNVSYIGSNGVVLDKTAPKITGIKDGGVYCKSMTAVAHDKYIKQVYYNGVAQTINSNNRATIKLEASDKTQTIKVVDKAGNSTEYSVMIYSAHTPGADATCTESQTCTKCGETVTETLGHNWDAGVVTKAPTATSEGVKTYTCGRCKTTKTEVIPKVDMNDKKIASTYFHVSDTEETISKITAGTTVAQFLDQLDNKDYLVLYTAGGEEITDTTALIGTGMILKLISGGAEFDRAELIVDGDVDGNGKITTTDTTIIRAHQLKTQALSGVYFKAADLDLSGAVNSTDCAIVTSHNLKKHTITGQQH